MDIFHFIPGYTQNIYLADREPAFMMLLAFVVTYLLARGYTRIAKRTGWGSASFGGVHAHHMVFGMVMAFVAAALVFSLLPQQGWILTLLAVLFGSGVALVLDEFALLFHLKDVYWEHEGRKSIDAIVLAAAFGSLFLLRVTPLGFGEGRTGWTLASVVLLNIAITLIAAYKGKIYFALFGLFIPTLSIIAAIRLAEPDSAWAHSFYLKKQPKKIKKSRKRYEHYEKVWRTRKERAWDIIGGKVGR